MMDQIEQVVRDRAAGAFAALWTEMEGGVLTGNPDAQKRLRDLGERFYILGYAQGLRDAGRLVLTAVGGQDDAEKTQG